MHAALAVVQTVSCAPNGGSVSCTTAGVTTTTGNLFVASAAYCCAAFVSITDNKSNTYGVAVSEITDPSTAQGQQRFIANGAGGASHTFTLTGASGAFFGALSVTEISGASSSPLDQTATDTDAGGTSHATDATATTAQADEILMGFGSSTGLTDYTTDTGAGWTEQTNITTDSDTEGLITGSKIVAAIDTYTFTYSTSNDVPTLQGIATYKASSGNRQRCIGCGIDKKVIGE